MPLHIPHWAALVGAALVAPSPLLALAKGARITMDLFTKIQAILAAAPWLTTEAFDLILIGIAVAESDESALKADLAKAIADSPLPDQAKEILSKDSILSAVVRFLVGRVHAAKATPTLPQAAPAPVNASPEG